MIPSIQARVEHMPQGFEVVESPLKIADFKGRTIRKSTVAYVFLKNEQPVVTTEDSSGHTQEVQCTVMVVMGIKSINDPDNVKGNAVLQQKRQALKAQLCGWIPQNAHTAMIFKNSALLAMADNGLWWAEQFTFTYYLDSPHQAG